MEQQLNKKASLSKIKVRWGDMDAFNHVNNTVYFRYFEEARVHFFEEIGLKNLIYDEKIGPILAHTSCQFVQPVNYPDTLTIHTYLKKLGESSLINSYRVFSEKKGIVAKGESVVVFFDYHAQKKAPIPQIIKEKCETYLK